MKKKSLLFGILAITLVITMSVVGCDNAPPDNGLKPITFVSTDSSGNTYNLVITPAAADKIAAGDSYELTIKKGGQNYVSKGTITNVTGNGILTMKPNSGSSDNTFTITVTDSGQMTKIEGSITVGEGEGEGTTVTGPGTVTPQDDNKPPEQKPVAGTFTLTGIPAEYNNKYAIIVSPPPEGSTLALMGCESLNLSTETFTLCKITSGSVSIPMWTASSGAQNLVRYSGNDTRNIPIFIHNTQTVSGGIGYQMGAIAMIGFENVIFSNGGATRAWDQKDYFETDTP